MALKKPIIIDTSEDSYPETPLNPNSDEIPAYGFWAQLVTGLDSTVGFNRDASNNLVLRDPVSGTKTLAQLLVKAPYLLSGVGDTVPLTLGGIAGQTAHLQDWKVGSNIVAFVHASGDFYVGNDKVWTAGNVGASSGLDADLLDGYHAAETDTVSTVAARDSSGVLHASDFSATSDARLKENVFTITCALQKVLALRGVTFSRKEDPEKRTKIGVIAQEVEMVLPELVNSMGGNSLRSVSYANMAGLFIEAIKEQQRVIDAQGKQIAELMSLVKKAE